MPFKLPVILEVIEDANDRPVFRTVKPFTFYSDERKKTYTVLANFKTDGASVPRAPFAWLYVGGKGLRAGVLHDWLYAHGMATKQIKDRKEADDVFWEALMDTGHYSQLADAMWDAVRRFGASHFVMPVKRKRKKK